MNQQELKKAALQILDDSKIGVMATSNNNKPHSRYMTFFNEDFTLYTATSKKTQKVEEVEKNPQAHILLGYEGEGVGDTYLEIEGKMSEHDDKETIEKYWNEDLSGWFSGPEDPDLVFLVINPSQMRLMNKKGEEPQDIELT